MIVKFRAKALVTFFPAALKTTTASAPAAAAVKDGARLPAPTTTVRGPRGKSDVGALKKSQPGTSQVECPAECPQGSVAYCEGNPTSTSPIECEEKCCFGTDACTDFTGCVKKDGSCTGRKACAGAVAPNGIENSCIGDEACRNLGGSAGDVGKISNSCNDNSACDRLGDYYGLVGNVQDSCNSDNACQKLGKNGGTVGNVQDSCNGKLACDELAFYAGYVDEVQHSCNGYKACQYIGYYGEVENVSNSCNAEEACFGVGYTVGGNEYEDWSLIGNITNSCTAKEACAFLGNERGKVGNIANSCNTEEACHSLARYGGTIKSITGSCNSNTQQPCRQLSGSKASKQDIGDISPFKRKWRTEKYRTANITVCNEDCDKDADCSGIKWRQGVQKPCRIFKGGFSGKCGKRDLCID